MELRQDCIYDERSERSWNFSCGKVNPLNAELNPICHLLALLGGATIVVVSRLRVKDQIHQNARDNFRIRTLK